MQEEARNSYRRKMLNPFVYFTSMVLRLPSIAFWGIRVNELNDEKAVVGIRQRWTNQNPFKSIYFSALNGAAELSTGILCQMHLQGRGDWSMLVVKFEAEFFKKATGKIIFTCSDGVRLSRLLDEIEKGESVGTFVMESVATNEQNVEIARFRVTWSFKKKVNGESEKTK